MPKERDFYQVSLKAFLKNKEGQILALKCVDTGSCAGFYDLPGGRIDTDEFSTPYVEILQREIAEELGQNIQVKIKPTPVAIGRHLIPAHLTRAWNDVNVLYVFFEVFHIRGEFHISDEHQGMKWLDLNAISLEEYFTSGVLEEYYHKAGAGTSTGSYTNQETQKIKSPTIVLRWG